ncbi:MAG: hypothetical protein IPJ74_03570 [Saprospiraceae bacterium]|nr:hypothetical protein [Saprospiraceae bacterium]
MKKSKSVLVMWAMAGVALGLSFGVLLHSIAVGLPLGLIVSFLTAVVVDRTYNGISRLVK